MIRFISICLGALVLTNFGFGQTVYRLYDENDPKSPVKNGWIDLRDLQDPTRNQPKVGSLGR
ncbi:MAG: hypothetical protein KDA84_27945, partial [Planctomycetaceae bacterium]|nr:hypothetical protein [Planctomycetaceae bacterium]